MYGLKEKALAKLYIKVIPLNKNDPDAMRLLYWKKPTDKHVSTCARPVERSLIWAGRIRRLSDRALRGRQQAFFGHTKHLDH